MKSIIAIALITFALGNILRDEHTYLKNYASFEIVDIEENPYKDLSDEELKAMFQVRLRNKRPGRNVPLLEDVPESYDFRTEYPECVQKIQDQQRCGSCWAFSGASALSERFCQATAGSVNPILSPQDSVSCDKNNYACQGGYLDKTWLHYEKKGIVTDSCFPYVSGDGKTVPACPTKCKNAKEEFVKHFAKGSKLYNNANAIKNTIIESGPIQTGFTVYSDFMQYKSGIYKRSSYQRLGGHAVVIVGWGVEGGVKYWIAQNSWGGAWGEKGYFRIAFGECGFDSNGYAGVPVL